MIAAELRQFVHKRANARCEYCHVRQEHDELTLCIDHVIAIKHHGPTIESNLALACFHCNTSTGANLSGVDPLTGAIVTLFNPREQTWDEHFAWHGPVLIGRTPTGRATIAVLNINEGRRLAIRQSLLDEGVEL